MFTFRSVRGIGRTALPGVPPDVRPISPAVRRPGDSRRCRPRAASGCGDCADAQFAGVSDRLSMCGGRRGTSSGGARFAGLRRVRSPCATPGERLLQQPVESGGATSDGVAGIADPQVRRLFGAPERISEGAGAALAIRAFRAISARDSVRPHHSTGVCLAPLWYTRYHSRYAEPRFVAAGRVYGCDSGGGLEAVRRPCGRACSRAS
jgi:hypothetical protein